jgi:hypothetical protein
MNLTAIILSLWLKRNDKSSDKDGADENLSKMNIKKILESIFRNFSPTGC